MVVISVFIACFNETVYYFLTSYFIICSIVFVDRAGKIYLIHLSKYV